MSIDFYNQTVDEYQEAKIKNPDLSVIDFLEKNNKFDSTKFSWDVLKRKEILKIIKNTFLIKISYMREFIDHSLNKILTLTENLTIGLSTS